MIKTRGEVARERVKQVFDDDIPSNILRNLGEGLLRDTAVDHPLLVTRLEVAGVLLHWSEEVTLP